jgi:hypothetical protein
MTWQLGTIAPGAVRTIRLALREKTGPAPGTKLVLGGVVDAMQMAPTFPKRTLTVPGR